MAKVIAELVINGYSLLTLDSPTPYKRYNFYRINGVDYEVVMAYDIGDKAIVVEADGGFVGKSVEFVMKDTGEAGKMIWNFEYISDKAGRIVYKYSRDDSTLDGKIEHDKTKNEARILVPCRKDSRSEILQDWSLSHFTKVIKAGFPESLRVCCG